jgi:hypothetical protein
LAVFVLDNLPSAADDDQESGDDDMEPSLTEEELEGLETLVQRRGDRLDTMADVDDSGRIDFRRMIQEGLRLTEDDDLFADDMEDGCLM